MSHLCGACLTQDAKSFCSPASCLNSSFSHYWWNTAGKTEMLLFVCFIDQTIQEKTKSIAQGVTIKVMPTSTDHPTVGPHFTRAIREIMEILAVVQRKEQKKI